MEKNMIEFLQKAIGSKFAVSFFLPMEKKGHILDSAFLYSSATNNTKRTRPFAMIIVDPKSGSLLEYKNSYIDDYMDGEKYPMNMQIDYSVPCAKTAKEQIAYMKKVNELYGIVRELFFKKELTEEERVKFAEYKENFIKAVPTALLPFYEGLTPAFRKLK